MHRRLVREIMNTPVISIEPDALAVDAAELMDEHDVRRIVVVDSEGFLCGIVTDADILEAETAESTLSPYDPGFDEEWLAVRDVMTEEVITIQPDASIGQLVEKMMQTKIGGIPVVEATANGKKLLPIGIVTETDIFQLIIEMWRAEEAATSRKS